MENVSQDFIFGTMATDERRMAYLMAELSGVSHRHRLAPLPPQPGQPFRLLVSTGPRIVADHVTAYYALDGREPSGSRGSPAPHCHAVAFRRIGPVWDTFLWGYLEEWEAEIPPQPAGTIVRYRIEAWNRNGGPTFWASEIIGSTPGDGAVVGDVGPGDHYLRAFGAEFGLTFVRRARTFACYIAEQAPPVWLADGLIYHVFIDRFAPGDGRAFADHNDPMGFYGGTIRGVTENLDYIASLGANAIWLSPIFPSPSHHGYDATDYMAVEPRLGTLDDMRALIAAAHTRGLRIILDYTANHVSNEHDFFQQALRDPQGPYGRWFTFTRFPDVYVSFFGVRTLPQLDNDYPPARKAMIEPALFWLAQGVDGFRLDYVIGPSHAFWCDFRAATRSQYPESAAFGEAVDTADLMRSYAGRLDGCFDFLLLQQMRLAFAFNSIGLDQFDAFLQRHLSSFPQSFLLPSFLDNHDMNRFLWVVGGDKRRLRLAALCQYTLPHPPVLYYGTEVGLSQQHDVRHADGSGHPEESRLPMLWGEDQDSDLLAFYRQLGKLRRETAAVWRGERRVVHLDASASIYTYACRSPDGHEWLVALNNSPQTRRVALRGRWELRLASESAASYQSSVVSLPPYSGAIFGPISERLNPNSA